MSAWVTDPAARLPVQDDRFKLEVLLNERSGDDWILRREPDISLPLRRSIQQSSWGMPTAVAEVLLFYKATAYLGVPKLEYRTQDHSGFLALVPHLNAEERAWLRQAISLVHLGHPWLPELSL